MFSNEMLPHSVLMRIEKGLKGGQGFAIVNQPDQQCKLSIISIQDTRKLSQAIVIFCYVS